MRLPDFGSCIQLPRTNQSHENMFQDVCGPCVMSFFFQAEDGIRDPLVTGVQTCALPISLGQATRACTGVPPTTWTRSSRRSEERRVGKECRSRWSPHHLKKKDRRVS